MNKELFEYGIQTEDSHWRAHVCWVVKHVFYYPTKCGLEAMTRCNYPLLSAFQDVEGESIETAKGMPVPPRKIEKCTGYPIPKDLKKTFPIYKSDSTTVKGSKAVAITKAMLLRGTPPLIPLVDEQDGFKVQIEGTDILVVANLRLQVKCDFKGGPWRWGGTGNLFLQTAECNPHKYH